MAMASPEFKILRVNKALCRMLGYDEQALMRLSFLDITHPDDAENSKLMATMLFKGDIPAYRTEKRFITNSGDTIWTSLTTTLIRYDSGEPQGLAMIEDISERRQALDALKESEERFRMMSEVSFEALSIVQDGKFVDVNSTFEKTFGYRLDELSGITPPDLAAPECRELAGRISMSHEEMEHDLVCLRRDGTVFQVEVRGKPVPYHGRTARVNAIRDITSRKRMEDELRAAVQELEAFAYSVSHDLRTPLRALDGFSKRLLENYSSDLDERGQHYLERIRAASQRMAQLIDDLLNLSRVTRTELRRESVDLRPLALTVVSELEKADPGRRVEFLAQENLVAQGDARLLRVVLENLLGNAWKFTARHRTARIELGRTQQDGKTAFFVKDDGAGFDMVYADKLFGAFQRLHSVSDFPGTGIGLATAQRIIHRHGGSVWADGAVEQGATFYFTL